MCELDNASFSSNGDAGGSWTSSNNSVATVDASGNVTSVGQGSATISYIVVATSPCTVDDIATFNVTVSGAPNAGAIVGTAALCDGETVIFTSNGDTGGNWTTSDATVATVDASGNVTAVGQGSATITYTVNAVAPCIGNDIATFNVTITAAPNAGTITGTGALCETGTSLFTSDGDAGGSWTSSDNAVATVDASGNVTAVGAGTATITYTVAAISPCTIDAVAQFDVSVTAAPNAGIDGDVLICTGEGVTSSSLFSELGGTPDATGTWSPQPAGAGVYTYTVSAAAPCLNPAMAIVTVTAENCEIIIPSGFTPGGDGENDTWEIIGLDEKYPDNLVIIYNRWGNEIYRSKQGQYSQAPWDGKYNGNEMPVSSYYYMILPFGEETEKEDIMNGTITIIKE
jgi:gliding motility-associated-like protein